MARPLVYSAVPTAFHPDGELDLAGTRRLFRHALAGGVDSLFVNGTTAEFPALTRAERAATLEAACADAGAERVTAHVGAASPHEVAQLTRDALERGLTSLAVITPFYLPTSVAGVRRQVAAARRAAPAAALWLYLFPDRTGVHVTPEQAAALIAEFDLAGAKLSIAGTEFVGQLADLSPAAVLSGNDALLREVVAAGGAGVVSGVSSSLPGPFMALARALGADDGADDSDDAEVAAARINAIVPVLGSSIAALKYSQLCQGLIASDATRMAIDPIDEAWRARVARVIA